LGREGHHSRAALNGLLLFGETWIWARSEDFLLHFSMAYNAPDIGNSVIQWENISILGKAVLSIPGVPSNSVTIKKDDDNSTPQTAPRFRSCIFTVQGNMGTA